jgi:metabolite-proton symporter
VRSASRERTPMKRVALSSFVGSTIEFYDFYVYGTAAALVFPKVFFPHLGSTIATIASLATFAAAFLSRPLGAVAFGHFGDRLGRKRTLVATLLIMGLSTVAVGLVPSAAAVGLAAPLILLVLRLLQGFALGGEWAGSALLTAEYAPTAQRGMWGMFSSLGGGAGLVLTSLIFLGVNITIGEKSSAFMSWGWRVPFLVSAALVVIALYVRASVNETPVFAAEKARSAPPKAPVADLFRFQRRHVVLASGFVVGIFAFRYMAGTYLTSYATSHLGYSRDLVMFVGVLGGLVLMALTAVSASLCDTLGRRRIMLVGYALGLPWFFAVMLLTDTGGPVLFGAGIIGTYAILGFTNGPVAAFMPEIFPSRYRYTGAGLAFNLGGILGGAIPPTSAGALMAVFGSWSIGLMMAIVVLASLVCTFLLPETMGTTLKDTDTHTGRWREVSWPRKVRRYGLRAQEV